MIDFQDCPVSSIICQWTVVVISLLNNAEAWRVSLIFTVVVHSHVQRLPFLFLLGEAQLGKRDVCVVLDILNSDGYCVDKSGEHS